MGPYSSPHVMIAHGGQSTVFKGPDDRWWATFGGRDSRAIFQDRPAILPLQFSNAVQYGKYTKTPFPSKPREINTEFGPWAEVRKGPAISHPRSAVHVRARRACLSDRLGMRSGLREQDHALSFEGSAKLG
jgi:hypothetical protein